MTSWMLRLGQCAYSLGRFRDEDGGATSIEYALIASLLSLALFVGAAGIGTSLSPIFSSASTHLSN